MKWTFFGETPCCASSALTSRVPMLLVPLSPIFLPTSWPTVVMGEFALTTSARDPGPRVDASARIWNLAPRALRRGTGPYPNTPSAVPADSRRDERLAVTLTTRPGGDGSSSRHLL